MKKNKKSDVSKRGYNSRMSKEAYEALKESAQKQGRSLSNMLSYWVLTMYEREQKLLAMQSRLDLTL